MMQTTDNGNLLPVERLNELRSEYQRGQAQLAMLDQRRQDLRDTLLRISGAIQVLEELLQDAGDKASLTAAQIVSSEER
jgi:prefoldin subunit 5